jgi:catechol 2,3-dioxygenase-like lactoylglutathione lyase family enzyme
MTALWAPLEVRDLARSAAFYLGLGLPLIDEFPDGQVFGAGDSGRIELVQTPAATGPPAIAIEVPTWAEVDRLAAYCNTANAPPGQAGAGTPAVFPRGHYGFFTNDPDGHPLLIWSEHP